MNSYIIAGLTFIIIGIFISVLGAVVYDYDKKLAEEKLNSSSAYQQSNLYYEELYKLKKNISEYMSTDTKFKHGYWRRKGDSMIVGISKRVSPWTPVYYFFPEGYEYESVRELADIENYRVYEAKVKGWTK